MIDGNEKAPRATTLEAKRRRKHDLHPRYHIGSGTATTTRAENSLAGRSANVDASRPVVTGPRPISHSSVLIAMAACIARGGRP